MPYELKCCALWLEEEDRLRQAWTFREGFALANGKGPIPLRYFESISGTPEEASRRYFTANRARREAQAGFGS